MDIQVTLQAMVVQAVVLLVAMDCIAMLTAHLIVEREEHRQVVAFREVHTVAPACLARAVQLIMLTAAAAAVVDIMVVVELMNMPVEVVEAAGHLLHAQVSPIPRDIIQETVGS